jgi:hypothetical protein
MVEEFPAEQITQSYSPCTTSCAVLLAGTPSQIFTTLYALCMQLGKPGLGSLRLFRARHWAPVLAWGELVADIFAPVWILAQFLIEVDIKVSIEV